MTKEELSMLANHSYIENPMELAERLELPHEEMISFLTLVHEYNEKWIQEEKRKLGQMKYCLLQNERAKEENLEGFLSDTPNPSSEVCIDKKVQEILSRISLTPLEEVELLLPDKTDKNFHSLMNQVMIHYYRDIVFLNQLMWEMKEEATEEERRELEQELLYKKEVFERMKKHRMDTNVEQTSLEANHTPPILIHLKNSKGISCLEEDIEQLPCELYKHFLKIYEPLIEGRPVMTKRFIDPNTTKIITVKNKVHQARIYMIHIRSNIFGLLGAMNKKNDWGKSESGFVLSRYNAWERQKDNLTSQLDDVSFQEEERNHSKKVLQLLKRG